MIDVRPAAATTLRWIAVPSTASASTHSPVLMLEHASLARAVLVQLQFVDGRVIVEDVATGIFGAGVTSEHAVEDFVTALRDHAEVLASDEILAPELQRQLEYLRAHLG